MSNILKALTHAANNNVRNIKDLYKGSNSVNNVGDALERYVADLFMGVPPDIAEDERLAIQQETFSYMGNSSNPPDLILRGGDAIEVKKIEQKTAQIALNSSFPKSKLSLDDPKITKACKECEVWEEKNLIYCIGHVSRNTVQSMVFVFGDCYAADPEVYLRVASSIKEGVEQIPGIEFSQTKELGRVNKVDPLGSTQLRIRGMWQIENPLKVFSCLHDHDYYCACIVSAQTFHTFPEDDILSLQDHPSIRIHDITIESPNNRAALIEAKLILVE